MTEAGGESGYLTPVMSRPTEGDQDRSNGKRRPSAAIELKVRERGARNGYKVLEMDIKCKGFV